MLFRAQARVAAHASPLDGINTSLWDFLYCGELIALFFSQTLKPSPATTRTCILFVRHICIHMVLSFQSEPYITNKQQYEFKQNRMKVAPAPPPCPPSPKVHLKKKSSIRRSWLWGVTLHAAPPDSYTLFMHQQYLQCSAALVWCWEGGAGTTGGGQGGHERVWMDERWETRAVQCSDAQQFGEKLIFLVLGAHVQAGLLEQHI